MIEQTYNPFGGETTALPTLAGSSSFSTPKESPEQPSNWLGWVLLIGSLIGVSYLFYRWRLKRLSENEIEKQESLTYLS